MSRLEDLLNRNGARVEAIIGAIDAGEPVDELVDRLARAQPWELAAAGQAFALDMLESEREEDGGEGHIGT